MKVLGCDPGYSGALALLDTDSNRIVDCIDMPTNMIRTSAGKTRPEINISCLRFWLDESAPDHAFIELVSAMPGQGVTSMFRFGQAFGELRATVLARNIPITMVPPRVWSTAMKVPAGADGAALRASQLFPDAGRFLALKKHHGRADAMLLALFGARSFGAPGAPGA